MKEISKLEVWIGAKHLIQREMKEIGNSCQGSWTLYSPCLILYTVDDWGLVQKWNKWIWFWCLDSLETLAKVADTDCYNTMELIIWFWKGNWKTSKQTKTLILSPGLPASNWG